MQKRVTVLQKGFATCVYIGRGHRQHHLNIWVFLHRKLAKLVHRSLFLDLIPSLHSDSLLFLGRKFPEGYHPFRLRVANFLRTYGHPPASWIPLSALHPTTRTLAHLGTRSPRQWQDLLRRSDSRESRYRPPQTDSTDL